MLQFSIISCPQLYLQHSLHSWWVQHLACAIVFLRCSHASLVGWLVEMVASCSPVPSTSFSGPAKLSISSLALQHRLCSTQNPRIMRHDWSILSAFPKYSCRNLCFSKPKAFSTSTRCKLWHLLKPSLYFGNVAWLSLRLCQLLDLDLHSWWCPTVLFPLLLARNFACVISRCCSDGHVIMPPLTLKRKSRNLFRHRETDDSDSVEIVGDLVHTRLSPQANCIVAANHRITAWAWSASQAEKERERERKFITVGKGGSCGQKKIMRESHAQVGNDVRWSFQWCLCKTVSRDKCFDKY